MAAWTLIRQWDHQPGPDPLLDLADAIATMTGLARPEGRSFADKVIRQVKLAARFARLMVEAEDSSFSE